MIPSRRLVQARIDECVLIVRTARDARAKREAMAGHPMAPERAEAEASDRIVYWERYMRRPRGRRA